MTAIGLDGQFYNSSATSGGHRMAAQCQACVVGVPLIKTLVGSATDPMGACIDCGSLTCGHHGYRAAKGKFRCIQCDVALQAGSAGWNAWLGAGGDHSDKGTAGTPTARPEDLEAQLRALLPGGVTEVVDSFDSWAAQHPIYRQLIELILEALDSMLNRLNEVRAGAEVLWVDTNDPEFADEFAAFWARMDARGKRLLAAALVMALVMNLPRWSLPVVLQRIAKVAGIEFRDQFPEPGHEIPFEPYRYR